MKLLVLSDSHGAVDAMRLAVEREQPDAVLFLGDCLRDAELLWKSYVNLRLETVPGNCDWGCLDEPEKLVEFGGVRILMLHGHTRNVKYDGTRAYYAAKEMGADVLLYGHTHRALVDFDGALYTLNPGSIRDRGTYGVVAVKNGKVTDCGTRQLEVAGKI